MQRLYYPGLLMVPALGIVAALALRSHATPGQDSSLRPPSVVLADGFAGRWPDHRDGTAWLTGQGYEMFARHRGQFVAVRAPVPQVPTEAAVSGSFRKLGGPPGGGYGLIVRDQGLSAGDGLDQAGEFVVAAVGDRGEVGVWERADSNWLDLVPWTASPFVHQGTSPNNLTVRLHGDLLTFIVNGIQVAELQVGFPTGSVGVFVSGDLNQVQLDRFRVDGEATRFVPPGSQPPPQRAEPPSRAPTARLRELLRGIAQDVQAIFAAFAGGPNDPHGPINDPSSLRDAAGYLDSAADKAVEVRNELHDLQENR